jgi:hypothetical protein
VRNRDGRVVACQALTVTRFLSLGVQCGLEALMDDLVPLRIPAKPPGYTEWEPRIIFLNSGVSPAACGDAGHRAVEDRGDTEVISALVFRPMPRACRMARSRFRYSLGIRRQPGHAEGVALSPFHAR